MASPEQQLHRQCPAQPEAIARAQPAISPDSAATAAQHTATYAAIRAMAADTREMKAALRDHRARLAQHGRLLEQLATGQETIIDLLGKLSEYTENNPTDNQDTAWHTPHPPGRNT